jgi:hypothetical protein
MIKGSQLVGRAVIDMEAAERLGKNQGNHRAT